ncbi:MAG: multidrug efflux SMR transporter [Aureispira sp.]|nr:multidrug efflux SMR transporter [Aureispira sp.]
MKWVYLYLAITAEVIATSALKTSENFTQLGPSIVVIIGYTISVYLLSLTLKEIPVGVAYAIWSGAGITLVSLVGYFFFKQSLDLPSIIGILLIIAGVLVLNLYTGRTPS